jgi:hypothetical protein
VDLARNCKAAVETPYYCFREPRKAPSTKCGGVSPAESCAYRLLGDGGIEMYIASFYAIAAGFQRCDDEQSAVNTDLPTCP